MRSPLSPILDSRLKGIVLDCDGVMLDSFQANIVFYNALRRGVGLAAMNAEESAFVHSHSVHESLRRIIPPDRWEMLENVKKGIRYTDLLPYLRLEPGLELFLRTARYKGMRLAICTNRTDTMGAILDRYYLAGFFFPVETAATVTFPKPHPEGLHKILGRWRMHRREIAFIGDSTVDEQTAATARVPFWAYKNERLRCDALIPSFETLSRWLLKRD